MERNIETSFKGGKGDIDWPKLTDDYVAVPHGVTVNGLTLIICQAVYGSVFTEYGVVPCWSVRSNLSKLQESNTTLRECEQ